MGLFDMMGGGGLTQDQQKYIGTMGLLGLAGQLMQAAGPSPVKQSIVGAAGKGLQAATMNMGEATKDVRLGQGVKMLEEQSQLMKAIQKMISERMSKIDAEYGPQIGVPNASFPQPQLGQPAPIGPTQIPPMPGYSGQWSRQMGLAPQMLGMYPQVYGL